jgi:transcriptional regulator with XRE-family HTH domain
MSNLATRVKKIRLQRGLSQTQLATKLGIGYMNIANLETGRVTNPRYLSELASALQTTVSYLVDGNKTSEVSIEAPMFIAALEKEIDLQLNKDYWVIEIDKSDKLFLTDNAKQVSKIKRIFK